MLRVDVIPGENDYSKCFCWRAHGVLNVREAGLLGAPAWHGRKVRSDLRQFQMNLNPP